MTTEDALSNKIKEWLDDASGWFTTTHLDTELSIVSPQGKNNRRQIIRRLVADGRIKRHPSITGKYRVLQIKADKLDWQHANPDAHIELQWPFGLENWVAIYPKSICVIAGVQNAGKTGFLLRFTVMNQHRVELGDLLPIEYFSSEMGREEFSVRMGKFENVGDCSFNTWERNSGFADVIRPNGLNIIDYLEVVDSFYEIAGDIAEIYETLTTGIAIIAIQKNEGAKLGRGGSFSLEKARLYLSLDHNELTIVKGKNWAVPGSNPNGKRWQFSLVDGCRFINPRMIQ